MLGVYKERKRNGLVGGGCMECMVCTYIDGHDDVMRSAWAGVHRFM